MILPSKSTIPCWGKGVKKKNAVTFGTVRIRGEYIYMLISLGIFLLCGVIAGIFAGLLGIGGGVIIVPILTFVFTFLNVEPSHIHHLCLGTSLATIMVTAISSARAHNKRGAVRWDIVKAITPGILVGTFAGGLVAAHIPDTYLKAIFVCFIYLVALDMFLGKKPKAQRELPGTLGTSGVGLGIGTLSSFVGIGGGTMSVPFMTFCNIPMHTAVGTSSAIGFPIAFAGTLGYIVGGYNQAGLPEGTLGYVHILAFLGIAAASFFTAPIGAKIAHKLPVATLKKIFAFFLIFVATRMLWSLLA